jgi:tetratricopeptide (TPR) repeat protein
MTILIRRKLIRHHRRILFFIFLLPLCVICNAQIEKIDGLRKILPSLKDSARIDCLIDLSMEFTRYVDMDSGSYYANTAYEESKKMNYLRGIAQFHLLMGIVNFRRQNNDHGEILNGARESLKWFNLTGNKKKIEITYFFLGKALGAQNLYDEAEVNLERSYQWAEKNGTKEWMQNSLSALYESVYRESGDYDKAFEVFQQYQQIEKSVSGKIDTLYELRVLAELNMRIENYASALNYYREIAKRMDFENENVWYAISYGEIFSQSGQFDSALYCYNLIDTAKRKIHDKPFFLVSKGEFYLLQNEYEEALRCFLEGLKYHRKSNDLDQIKRTLLDVAKTYLGLRNDNAALAFVREGLELSKRTKSKQYIRDAYQILYIYFDRKQIPDSAYWYFRKYMAQKELVASDVVKGKFAAYNYEQKIALLDKEKQLHQQKISKAGLQRNFLLTGIIAIVIIGAIFFRSIILKRKNEVNLRAIAENELKLQKLESEKTRVELQQQATELEMQALRAQMNPHFIFNCLSSINRFILKNEAESASDYLTKFSRLIRMVLNNSRKSAIILEDELEMLRLYLDLERLRFKNSFDYSITFHNNFDASSIYIPPLLLQPFAENAIWHGLMHKEGQGWLEIAFGLENRILNCYITDNGIGRNNAEALKSKSAEKKKSMGMQITADRIALLNRDMEQTIFGIEDLVDENGKAIGTRVTIKIRYKKGIEEFSNEEKSGIL